MATTDPGIAPFGTLADGTDVQKVTLNDGTLSVAILTFGAIVQDVRLAGVPHSLTIGTEDMATYAGPMASAGGLIGPVVNRISDGSADLDGKTYRFERNQDGQHTCHAGAAGTHRKVWTLAERTDTHVELTLTLPDGEGGFPGTRTVTARYALTAPGTLEMQVTVTTDAATWINFANHSYWNLDGTDTYASHRLTIDAERYCVPGPGDLATGEVRSVAGTPYDFRQERTLAPGQDAKLDLNFCLAEARRTPRQVLTLTGASGVRMELETTEPGVQIYDAGGIRTGGAVGHHGKTHAAYCALAIEAQGWPDAPSHAAFPSTVLRPGETYAQITRWRFAQT
ncbi:aldose epimerase family protein [Meridianimarinicoccus sp. MJW13]|uniref:aldose epimerase family protein n=1 Tax=Meridianimarinicoccus sp. MJW13 TaxID=2720031 RepID=UPI0018686F6A|nr:aldose epimerase family protein [Fluviibacterium sp. MJW13]